MSRHTISALFLAPALIAATAAAQSVTPPAPEQTVATIDGQTISTQELASSAEGQLQPLRSQEYEIKRKALDDLIEQKLLENAAKAKGITTEQLVQQEIESKVKDPSDDEVQGFYLAQGARLNRPLDEALKAQIRQVLRQAEEQQARQDYLAHLRAENKVVVLLAPPRVHVAYDPKRVRGGATASVMIVEFSDYQCPYCRQAEATVEALLAKYGDKVRFSYRDFPLTTLHPQAMIAAEASRCAEEQGKFWEYHDELFKAASLEKSSLVEYARNLKLDSAQFESCLTGEKYKKEIEADEEAGRNAGVNGTPGFFINGIFISGAKPESEYASVIDDELGRAGNLAQATASIAITRTGQSRAK